MPRLSVVEQGLLGEQYTGIVYFTRRSVSETAFLFVCFRRRRENTGFIHSISSTSDRHINCEFMYGISYFKCSSMGVIVVMFLYMTYNLCHANVPQPSEETLNTVPSAANPNNGLETTSSDASINELLLGDWRPKPPFESPTHDNLTSSSASQQHPSGHESKEGMRYPVASFDFNHVATPYIISLWIIIVGLAKIGE